jgi:hypothetical protein
MHRKPLVWRPRDDGAYEAAWTPGDPGGYAGGYPFGDERFVLEPRLWRYRIHHTGEHRPIRLAWTVTWQDTLLTVPTIESDEYHDTPLHALADAIRLAERVRFAEELEAGRHRWEGLARWRFERWLYRRYPREPRGPSFGKARSDEEDAARWQRIADAEAERRLLLAGAQPIDVVVDF